MLFGIGIYGAYDDFFNLCTTRKKYNNNNNNNLKNKNKSVAYSSQGSHTGQLDFCNWLADGSTTG